MAYSFTSKVAAATYLSPTISLNIEIYKGKAEIKMNNHFENYKKNFPK